MVVLPFANSQTRKLAAILAADVVGYSRMMGDDEAGTAKLVRERREAAAPIVASYVGRVFKTMGDAMLIEFPSVVAAVECALAMQQQNAEHNSVSGDTRNIVYRIGVHLGDVLIDGADMLGDAVNIAARLEGVAEPGRVCISGATYEHVRGRVEAPGPERPRAARQGVARRQAALFSVSLRWPGFVDLGEKALKNIDRPIRVYSVQVAAPGSATRAAAALEPLKAQGPSIAVLPLANMSGDPEQEYFADGISEDIIIALAKLSQLFVIARNSSFAFKGRNVLTSEIAKSLGVRYLLEGGVRKSGSRVRITAQLIDSPQEGMSAPRATTASSPTFSPCRTTSQRTLWRCCSSISARAITSGLRPLAPAIWRHMSSCSEAANSGGGAKGMPTPRHAHL
jgi:adenylate cyclase